MDKKILNEFRKDLVSGDWTLFATARSRSLRKYEPDPVVPKEECPFEDLNASQNEIIWRYPDNDEWFATLIKNKFPAVKQGLCEVEQSVGPFKTFDAIGDHEVVVYRDHNRSIYDFTEPEMKKVIEIYKKRYTELASQSSDCMKYILPFHNHGKVAGASVYHPHSQIITTPILPPDVSRSINGSFQYYKEHKKMVYSDMLEWELKERKRVIYENSDFIVFCPFTSKYPYEMRIFAKEHHAHFHEIPEEKIPPLADALRTAIQKMGIVLDKSPFNFYIHAASMGNGLGVHSHEYYHWHIEIVPHLKIDAGFEIGTGIEINIIDPDEAAEQLRNAQVQP